MFVKWRVFILSFLKGCVLKTDCRQRTVPDIYRDKTVMDFSKYGDITCYCKMTLVMVTLNPTEVSLGLCLKGILLPVKPNTFLV